MDLAQYSLKGFPWALVGFKPDHKFPANFLLLYYSRRKPQTTKLENYLKSCFPFLLYTYSPFCSLALGKAHPLWQASGLRPSHNMRNAFLSPFVGPAELPQPCSTSRPVTPTRHQNYTPRGRSSYLIITFPSYQLKNVRFLYPVDVICLVCTLCSRRVLAHTFHESSEEQSCRNQGTWRCCCSV